MSKPSKPTKKRILSLFTALILFIGITAACGNSENSSASADSETVMVLTVYNNAGEEIAKFEGNDIKLDYEQDHIRSGTSPYVNVKVNGQKHQYYNVSITNIPKHP